jgi:hypothetical protein
MLGSAILALIDGDLLRIKAMNMESQSCAICHQPLPGNSKLATASVPAGEAAQNGWNGYPNADGTVRVDMCLQCQIDRSKNRTRRELNAALLRNYGLGEES